MHALLLPALLAPLLATAHPSPNLPSTPFLPHRSLAEFEERFVDSLPYTRPNSTALRLIGYKTITIPAHEAPHFDADWAARLPTDWNTRVAYEDRTADIAHHFYYDAPARHLRVYFPVEGALLATDNGHELVEADELGQLTDTRFLHEDEARRPPCHVVGRKQTGHVTGVEGNVIRDGVIYLSTAAQPVRRVGSHAYIYDFGAKEVHDHRDGHSHSHARRDGDEKGEEGEHKKGGSCNDNHNGDNCSKAYNINMGRCPPAPKTCMDYNGFITDCKKGTTKKFGIPSFTKTVKFVGSDCSVAVARGHCWNEIM